MPIAQILLTEDDFSLRYRYLSLRTTLNKILEFGVVPIINQNDTVSTIAMNPMMAGMKVCFADNDKCGVGCIALKERFEQNCPFFREREKYIEDQEYYREQLRENKPKLYAKYYGGKEKTSAYR